MTSPSDGRRHLYRALAQRRHGTFEVDFRGRLVVPGFNNAHGHFLDGCAQLDDGRPCSYVFSPSGVR
jgi:predicted amidohydrolase YtcJ